MNHNIRWRITLVFIGMAAGPLVVVGIILALISYLSPQQASSGASAPAANLVIITLILAGLMAGIAAGLGFLFARKMIEPILALTEAAGAIGAGDLTARPLTSIR